jgi:hypothetical protein
LNNAFAKQGPKTISVLPRAKDDRTFVAVLFSGDAQPPPLQPTERAKKVQMTEYPLRSAPQRSVPIPISFIHSNAFRASPLLITFQSDAIFSAISRIVRI